MAGGRVDDSIYSGAFLRKVQKQSAAQTSILGEVLQGRSKLKFNII